MDTRGAVRRRARWIEIVAGDTVGSCRVASGVAVLDDDEEEVLMVYAQDCRYVEVSR